jgi:hypothetical protein
VIKHLKRKGKIKKILKAKAEAGKEKNAFNDKMADQKKEKEFDAEEG